MNEKIQTKLLKNMAKMQNMNTTQSQEVMNHMKQHWAQMGKVTKCTVDESNGDVEMHVDIPIHHSDGTTTCTSSSTTSTTTDNNGKATTSTATNVYPNLTNEPPTETTPMIDNTDNNGFEDLSAEANEAKLNEAVAKMGELGFNGAWVRELLKNVNGDVAKAVEAMNPSK